MRSVIYNRSKKRYILQVSFFLLIDDNIYVLYRIPMLDFERKKIEILEMLYVGRLYLRFNSIFLIM